MTPLPPRPPPSRWRFGPFTLDTAAARLVRDGSGAVALRPKAFDLLVALMRRPGELVTKDELLDSVWGRRFITEGVIKSAVGELRSALGDDPRQPRWIETVARRGYRFGGALECVEPVHAAAAADAAAAAAAGAGAGDGAVPVVDSPNAGAAAATQPPADGRRWPGNLPAALEPVIGRDAELAELAALLAARRLLTIAGPSGIGKTRLALALAAAQRAAWPDGVWFVELAALAAETATLETLSALLARTLQLDAAAASGLPATLARALQPLALLLVIDNAEHLLTPLAPLVAALLAQAPSLRLVVTSQEPLRIAGEQTYRLSPLSLPAACDDAEPAGLLASGAVRLFVERVAAGLPGFALTTSAAQSPQQLQRQRHAVANICRALDGVPLALELAAARVPLLGVQAIADLLRRDMDPGDPSDPGDPGEPAGRLQLLAHGARTAAPRQRSLRDALQWSHGLLDDVQRRVFRRLGVFRGGFSLEAAQAVCPDDDDDAGDGDRLTAWGVLDAVDALIDKSFVVAQPADGGAPPRFTVLESLRAFALERLAEAGETERTRDRHLHAVRANWQRADALALVDPLLPWLARQLPEVDNLRAALGWAGAASPGDAARAAAGVALAAATALLWQRAGLVAEGRDWIDRMSRRAGETADTDANANTGAGDAARCALDLARATLAIYASAYPPADALRWARQAADGFERAGDPQRAYFALYLVYQAGLRGRPPTDAGTGGGRHDAVLARMQGLQRPDWSELLTRFLRNARGYELRLAGRSDAYLAFCRDELARCRRLRAVAEGWTAAQGLMLAEHDIGRVDAALAVGRQALAEIRAAGRLSQHSALLALWTTMLAETGDTAAARTALAEALPALRRAGTPWMANVALVWLSAHDGRPRAAAALLGWNDADPRARGQVGPGGYIVRSLRALQARLEQQLGAAALARACADGESLGDAAAAERLAFGDGEPAEANR